MDIVRCLLSIAAAKGWGLHQIDVHNAFLHGNLHETIYIERPPGFHPPKPNMVCRLRKLLYGLRQEPHQSFFKLAYALRQYDFQQSPLDHSLFIYHQDSIFLALLIYVDDLVLTGNNAKQCQAFKAYLQTCFKLKDLGLSKYFLGIEVAGSVKGLFLCQRKYALDILIETSMLGARQALFPMEQNHKFSNNSGDPLHDASQY